MVRHRVEVKPEQSQVVGPTAAVDVLLAEVGASGSQDGGRGRVGRDGGDGRDEAGLGAGAAGGGGADPATVTASREGRRRRATGSQTQASAQTRAPYFGAVPHISSAAR